MAEYIERDAAIELLQGPITMSMCLSQDECLSKKGQRAIDLELIKSIPSADVQPVRHGHDTRASRYFHCSVCDYGVADVYEDGPTLVFERQKEWNYCPNCGCRMDLLI